jgi:predicted transcriptional regulator
MTEIEVWSIRLDPDVASQLVRIAEELTKRAAGAKVTRSHVARMAVERGLPALEKELGLERKTRKRKK